MASIAVCIPTFRRPGGLQRLLDGLAALETNHAVTVIVADDDPTGLAGHSVANAARNGGYRWPIKVFAVEMPGLSEARNALVRAAMDLVPDFVAMIDDDEVPEPGWLDALVATHEKTGAELVSGPVLPAFEQEPPRWMMDGRFFEYHMDADGSVPMLLGTGNLLASRRVFDAIADPWFDPHFSRTGGEDDDFFVRAKAAGFGFAWSASARVAETIPAVRANRKWLQSRAFRTGNSWVRVRQFRRPAGWSPGVEVAKAAAGLVTGSAIWMTALFSPAKRFEGERRVFRALGKIAALRGRAFNEYETD